jgi:aminoglycoside phosphotransferase (APT) family kinase protein
MAGTTGDPWALGAVRLRHAAVTGSDVLAAVNRSRGGGYQLVRQFPHGEFGAWLVRQPADELGVLKCRYGTDSRDRIRSVAAIVASLAERGYPAPTVLDSDYDRSVGTWYLVEYLPGETPSELDARLAADIRRIVELQADHSLPADERARSFDWSDHVRSRTIDDPTWIDIALRHSDESAALARSIMAAIEPHANTTLATNDVVHGDLLASQLLVSHGRVTGVIDWEQTGIGDRGLDLVLLFLNAHAQASRRSHDPDPEVLASLLTAAIQASGEAAVTIFLAYQILSMVSFVIEYRARTLAWRIRLGHEVWNSFERLR